MDRRITVRIPDAAMELPGQIERTIEALNRTRGPNVGRLSLNAFMIIAIRRELEHRSAQIARHLAQHPERFPAPAGIPAPPGHVNCRSKTLPKKRRGMIK